MVGLREIRLNVNLTSAMKADFKSLLDNTRNHRGVIFKAHQCQMDQSKIIFANEVIGARLHVRHNPSVSHTEHLDARSLY